VPFVFDVPHQQGTVELRRSLREQAPILEKTRLDPTDGQRLNLPVGGAKFQSLELAVLPTRRVADRTALEEPGRFIERAEDRVRGKLGIYLPDDRQVQVIAINHDAVLFPLFLNIEPGMVMNAGEQSATNERVEPG
jgi:hypothetical protein